MIRKYPAVFLLGFIVFGVIFADRTHLPAWVFLLIALATGVTGLFLLTQSRQVAATVLLAVCVGTFAGFHFAVQCYDTGPQHLSRLLKEPEVYRVYGQVSDWPDLKPNRTEIKISLDSLGGTINRPVKGGLLLKISDTTTVLQRGDHVEFTGRIYPLISRENDIGFDYQRYLNLRGVSGIVYLPTLLNVRVDRRSTFGFFHAVDRLRDAIVGSFRRNLEPTQAALASGFLIGETRNIPLPVYHMFRDSGTLHLLAVSGSNVALVLLVAVFLLRPFALSRWKRALVLIGVIVIFTALSYGEPSVIRASVMATLVIAAGLVQRRYDLNNIIALTAVIILLVDPAQLYDVGFQLSFVTAWGLIFAVPKIARLFEAYHSRLWYRWIAFPAIVAFVAQVASTPLVAFHFNRVPVMSVIANLVIVPFVSAAVIGLMLMLLANLIWPILGLFVGSLVNMLLGWVLRLLHLLGGESMTVLKPAGLIPEQWLSWLMVGSYVLMIIVAVSIGRRQFRKAALITVLVAVNVILVMAAVSTAWEQKPTMEVTSVPGGVAALVYRPGAGEANLVLAGLQARDYPVDERILCPWLESRGVTELNAIFVASCTYGAIDDVFRLASTYHSPDIYIHESLQSSFADVGAMTAGPNSTPRVTGYGGSPPESIREGITPCNLGVLVRLGGHSALVTDRIREGHFRWQPPCSTHLLVVGERWQPCAADWISLRSRGTTAVVCSKIALHLSAENEDAEFSPDQVIPDYLYDLNQLGSIRVSLAD